LRRVQLSSRIRPLLWIGCPERAPGVRKHSRSVCVNERRNGNEALISTRSEKNREHLIGRTGASQKRSAKLKRVQGKIRMNLGSELLNLRRNRASSVAALLSGMERVEAAKSATVRMTREFALNDLSDAVLANVAVHANESCWGDDGAERMRRPARRTRRKPLGFEASAGSYQRRLFA